METNMYLNLHTFKIVVLYNLVFLYQNGIQYQRSGGGGGGYNFSSATEISDNLAGKSWNWGGGDGWPEGGVRTSPPHWKTM
jgi:hypothetical protein